ncbi:MAG TPA: winged helix-turn-helix domain-containing protein [Amycolatopsis sp.]|uniref:winged helix-turn-helix domain-containing protein n=1 Tax=Amycolatopsis sp. TaxID=37632 RepID=UPI002B476BA6|nr:winged helix-turn-helix domain-containing protein [Amycolatopsis sp.]HKS44607.1 winged helix-turn-helix domain-containing protein [Amycolatopsis sp.]
MTKPLSSKHLCPKHEDDDQLVRYHLDRNATTYLYDQMVDHLTERIAPGDLAVNTTLPAEVQLARQYGVSLGTARRATEILRQRGLAVTLKSKGTFVVARPEDATNSGDAADEPEPGWLALVQGVDQ